MPVFKADDSTPLVQNNAGHFGFSATKIDDLMASEYTLVGIAVDISGSVIGWEKDMEKALKEVVKACQKSPRADNLMVRLILFNSSVDEFHGFKMLTQINLDDYTDSLQPGGMTALFDASVDIIESVGNYGQTLMENEFNCNGIVFVITDGYKTAGKLQDAAHVAKAQSETTQKERLESCRTVLIGVNPGDYSASLQDFKDEGNFDQYVELQDAEAGTLAKLADFVSQSISSTSQMLGSGQPSQPINPSTVF